MKYLLDTTVLIDLLRSHSAAVSYLKTVIAERAGLWRRQFGPSHGVGIMDAMVAAAANRINATLVSHNRKHFPMFADLIVPY